MQIKKIQRRTSTSLPQECHLSETIHPLLRQLYTARGILQQDELERGLAKLHDYRLLDGIEQAVELLYTFLINDKHIVIVGDFDTDGATSTALMLLALKNMGFYNVDYLIPNRFEQGYGLSVDVVKQAQQKKVDLIITVDNGISSFEGVEFARQQDISVIITDHHLQGEKLPCANAIINPNKTRCSFPSKALSGVGVAFYFMIALRAYLRQKEWFTNNQLSEFNLAELLDLVAVGTVADVVALDRNNRILVYQGLNRIRSGMCRPGIIALLALTQRKLEKLTANDLGFVIAPRLNAAGRLDNMSIGVELLICNDPLRAKMLAAELDTLNAARKEIEQSMQKEALTLFSQIEQGITALPSAIAIYNEQWHQGVSGILAARLKDRFYRPVIVFAPMGNGILKGSARSIKELHIKDLLEQLNTRFPDVMISFGGHAMAAGLTVKEEKFNDFQHAFETLSEQHLQPEQINNVIVTDGELDSQFFSLETVDIIRQGGPWGQGFPEPLFDGKFNVLRQQLVGSKHLKVLVEPLQGGSMLEGIAFNVDLAQWPDQSVKQIEIAFHLTLNEFKGRQNMQLMIEYLSAI